MNTRTVPSENLRGHLAKCLLRALMGACLVLLCGPFSLSAQEKAAAGKESQGAGIYFNAGANAKDVGLPIYPGARPHKDRDDDKPSAKFGVWGSSFAFKLAVVKLESSDSPQKVAVFYKKALSKYGEVLDCGAASAQAPKDAGDGKSSKRLSCEDDKPEPGHMTFKAGTKEKQHVVGIQPNGDGTLFQLVYVESPDSEKK